METSSPSQKIRVAVAGNPNSGKTSIFNALTGMRQHVGNWPGVTVEKIVGHAVYDDIDIEFIDLPGTYSLSPYSPDERVARDFLLFERPDAVCVVVDGTSLERSLYLVAQIVELNIPFVLALNMIDIVEARGMKIDTEKLSALIGAPVVPTVARSRRGIRELVREIIHIKDNEYYPVPVDYGKETERAILNVVEKISLAPQLAKKCHTGRFISAMLLAGDPEIEGLIYGASENSELEAEIAELRMKLEARERTDGETILANARHGWASGIFHEVVEHPTHDEPTVTDKIDDVLLHKFLGLPIFGVAMFLVFMATFGLGRFPTVWIEAFFGWLGGSLDGLFASLGAPEILNSLVVNGIIEGVGGVLVFLPNIAILFFFVAILEDSGYMARAAFLVDNIMHRMGLHGKSFIPIILGFGCTVPAVMATRTLENREDRLLTILILPFVLCSARIPVFVLLSSIFFARCAGIVMFSMYLLSILVAIFTAKLLKTAIFPGLTTPFVMELPPYHVPSLRGILLHTWERSWAFIRKAGTVILVGSVIIWALGSMPPGAEYASEGTWAASIGKFLEPLVKPFGSNWIGAVALLFGFAAKEIVVSTLTVLAGAGDIALGGAMREIFTPLSAYAFMVFTLIYTPCIATVAVIKKETQSWKWTAVSVALGLALAWILATLVYTVGSVLGFS
ncbi:MAG TPA: ferrous iron transport protein B [candidate division Zixibacteria bacterium]|nr:ferrous iron transport protein B [candidate division Zixibacteria bacterium]